MVDRSEHWGKTSGIWAVLDNKKGSRIIQFFNFLVDTHVGEKSIVLMLDLNSKLCKNIIPGNFILF